MVSGPYRKNQYRRRWPWTGTGTICLTFLAAGVLLAIFAIITH